MHASCGMSVSTSPELACALFSSLTQASKYLHTNFLRLGYSVDRAVKSGVVRWDGSSLAAIRFEQYFTKHADGHKSVENAVRRHFDELERDEDAGLRLLRYIHQLTSELGDLRDTGGFDELQRDGTQKFCVGDMLWHQQHGLVVVYGWEPQILPEAQDFKDPTTNTAQILADNRKFFASIERVDGNGDDACSSSAFYRVMTKEGVAHFSHEQLLSRPEPPPTRANFQPVRGTSFFFDGTDGRRYFPNPHLERRYPQDAATAVAALRGGA